MEIRKLYEKDIPEAEAIFDLYWSDSFRENLSNKLNEFVNNNPKLLIQNFVFYVAEENGEVVGVAALRSAPEHMKQYTTTNNPAEFYVLASKYKGRGIGTALRNARIETAKDAGYTEALFFSGENHKDSWDFHDASDFERVGEMIAPNGEKGFVWRMSLIT